MAAKAATKKALGGASLRVAIAKDVLARLDLYGQEQGDVSAVRTLMVSVTKTPRAASAEPLDGLTVLRAVLRRLRSDDQGGYADAKDGKFSGNAWFVSSSLPQTTPEELDALFTLAGIVPDSIVPLGDCRDCVHANSDGTEGGWAEPCCGCKHPVMDKFVPVSSLTARSLRISDVERSLLLNADKRTETGDRAWWAEGIVVGKVTKKWHADFARCRKLYDRLVRQGFIRDTPIGGRRLMLKGRLALERHNRKVA